MNTRTRFGALALSALPSAFIIALAPSSAVAHGAPEFPISRQYNCYKNPSLPACQAAIGFGGAQAIYDWNGVNQARAAGNHRAVAPDLKICAGGQEEFKGFDLPRADWPATAYSPGADGKYEYRYYASAPHRTQNWTFFLTRDGWNPSSALRWSDLEQVQQLGPDEIVTSGSASVYAKTYTMKLSLPRRTGKHVLFSAWQRSDSTEAFYACSDVDFGGNSTPSATTSVFKQIGQLSAAQDLPPGSEVRLRVFNAAGSDLETISVALGAATLPPGWLGQLASKVNQTSAYVKVGSLQGGNVVVPSGATVMDVYLQNPKSDAHYALGVTLPITRLTTAQQPSRHPPQATPEIPRTAVQTPSSKGATAWVDGGSYSTGQIVSYQGQQYRNLTAHTAWPGSGWNPRSTPALWQLVGPSQGGGATNALPVQSTSTTPPAASTDSTPAWVDGGSYARGQIVRYGGRQYRCLQPHTAWTGAGWNPTAAPALWQPL